MIQNSEFTELGKFQIMEALGASASFYRVRLPNEVMGYIPHDAVELADDAINKYVSETNDLIFSAPSEDSHNMEQIIEGEEIKILGANAEYNLIEKISGRIGWVKYRGKHQFGEQ